jgi:hypothetical protein
MGISNRNNRDVGSSIWNSRDVERRSREAGSRVWTDKIRDLFES